MSEEHLSEDTQSSSPHPLKTLLICLIIIGLGSAGIWGIFSTEPEPVREGATKKTAMLVDVIPLEKGTYSPTLNAVGNVVPAQELVLEAQVDGRLEALHPQLIKGGIVNKGDQLLKLDDSDYRVQLQKRQSELVKAQAALGIERGQQRIAKSDYELVKSTAARTLDEDSRALILRQPQRLSVEANIRAAQADVQQAQLDLKRTSIEAPFNAIVTSESIEVGAVIGREEPLARLVGTDSVWVEVDLPVRYLDYIASGSDGSKARLHHRNVWTKSQFRHGIVERIVPTLDQQTRLAQVLVRVDDPLSLSADNSSGPPLLFGSFVDVAIQGKPLADVVRIKRDYLRKDNTLWLMQDDSLVVHKVDVIFTDPAYAYVRGGLSGGEWLVTTDLASVREGAALQRRADSE